MISTGWLYCDAIADAVAMAGSPSVDVDALLGDKEASIRTVYLDGDVLLEKVCGALSHIIGYRCI